MGPVVTIWDPTDGRVDEYRNLTDAELRQREEPAAGLFMVEGLATIRHLLRSDYAVRSLLLTPARLDELAPDLAMVEAEAPIYLGDNELLRSITGFHFHRGALAAGERPPPAPWRAVAHGPVLAVAEGIGDHENMGALFRNAAAFGVGAILLSPSCVDPLYRRAIRVSMGHVLRVPWARLEPWPAALSELRSTGYRIQAMTPDPAAVAIQRVEREVQGPVAVLIGTEGRGLSAEALASADQRVWIPMARGVDSLNVATAAAIAFHRLAGP